jgi:DNA helicase-2/ATP-dependent DNA helicase PcrA
MEEQIIIDNNHIDDHVDVEIKACFNKDNPKSFFTFAGAGSGKTRSLVNTLSFLNNSIGSELAAYSKQIAVITYTNAACNEILRRVDYKHIFSVSTIHSFLWEPIKNHQHDIKEMVKKNIVSEINEVTHVPTSLPCPRYKHRIRRDDR